MLIDCEGNMGWGWGLYNMGECLNHSDALGKPSYDYISMRL